MAYTYDMEPEEIELARKQAASSIQITHDEDSELRWKKRFDEENALYLKAREEYDRQVNEANQSKELEDKLNFERLSGGRNKLVTKHGQVLFSAVNCEYCDAEVMKPMSGWNMFRNTSGYKGNETWEKSQQDEQSNYDIKHSCPQNVEVLSKKISAMEKNFDEYKEYVNEYFRRKPTL